MKKKKIDHLNTRHISLMISYEIFFNNKNLKNAIEINQNFIKKNTNDRSFIYYLICVCIRRNKQISIIYNKFIEKKIDSRNKYLKLVFMLGTAEVIWLKTPDYAVLNEYVEIAKRFFNKKISSFVNAVFRKIVTNKNELLNSSSNLTENIPERMLNNWKKQYGENTTNKIIQFISIVY